MTESWASESSPRHHT